MYARREINGKSDAGFAEGTRPKVAVAFQGTGSGAIGVELGGNWYYP